MSEKYAPEVGGFKKTSQWKTTFRRLCRNRGAVIGMVILFIILMMALFADLLFDYETMVEANNIPEPRAGRTPSAPTNLDVICLRALCMAVAFPWRCPHPL